MCHVAQRVIHVMQCSNCRPCERGTTENAFIPSQTVTAWNGRIDTKILIFWSGALNFNKLKYQYLQFTYYIFFISIFFIFFCKLLFPSARSEAPASAPMHSYVPNASQACFSSTIINMYKLCGDVVGAKRNWGWCAIWNNDATLFSIILYKKKFALLYILWNIMLYVLLVKATLTPY